MIYTTSYDTITLPGKFVIVMTRQYYDNLQLIICKPSEVLG